MKNDPSVTPAWFPELMEKIQAELVRLESDRHNQEPDLEREREALHAKIAGWIMSLANRDLDLKVRRAIESESASAQKRIEEIDEAILVNESREQRACDAVDADAVLQRLRMLSDVLANYGPTRANLELSLHIDRLVCYSDGRIEMRTCKLGALPEVAELLLDLKPNRESQSCVANGQSGQAKGTRGKGPRRRGRLRTSDCDDSGTSNFREIADFAADTYRFDGLSEDWFWVDEFRIPVKRAWVEENADAVLQRYEEIERSTGMKPTLNDLAGEFNVSRPTIRTALDIATGKRPPRHERKCEKRKFTMPLDEPKRQEIIRLYHVEHVEQKEIGVQCGVHRSTVERVLNNWDKDAV